MPETPGEVDEKRAYLEHFLRENAAQLTGILRAYVVRMQPAPPAVVQSMAEEVFQDAVLETLQHAERFNPTMQPRAWFLAIATNVLRRKQSSKARRALKFSPAIFPLPPPLRRTRPISLTSSRLVFSPALSKSLRCANRSTNCSRLSPPATPIFSARHYSTISIRPRWPGTWA